jgi:hypothetical protein
VTPPVSLGIFVVPELVVWVLTLPAEPTICHTGCVREEDTP